MTELAEIREGWNTAAKQDAMFHILTDPAKLGGGWDPDEFFAHGRAEIDAAMERISPVLEAKDRALDFGCGVGRLTQALVHYFEQVVGVDVSPEMVERAEAFNHSPWVRFRVNIDWLAFRTNSFDLVYSMIVLQHMPRALAHGYVKEFVRVLRPGGIAFFQLPEGPDTEHQACPWLSMWTTPRETVQGWLTGAGAEVLSVDVSDASGAAHVGWEYMARKAN